MVDGINSKAIGAHLNNSPSKKVVNDKAQGQKPNTIFGVASGTVGANATGHVSGLVHFQSQTNGILEGTVQQTVTNSSVAYQGDVEVDDTASGKVANKNNLDYSDIANAAIEGGLSGAVVANATGHASGTVQVPVYTNGILEGTVQQTVTNSSVAYQGDVEVDDTASGKVANKNNLDYSDIANAAIEGGVNGAINDISSKSE